MCRLPRQGHADVALTAVMRRPIVLYRRRIGLHSVLAFSGKTEAERQKPANSHIVYWQLTVPSSSILIYSWISPKPETPLHIDRFKVLSEPLLESEFGADWEHKAPVEMVKSAIQVGETSQFYSIFRLFGRWRINHQTPLVLELLIGRSSISVPISVGLTIFHSINWPFRCARKSRFPAAVPCGLERTTAGAAYPGATRRDPKSQI